jgi:hypothetical protein
MVVGIDTAALLADQVFLPCNTAAADEEGEEIRSVPHF